MWGRKGIQFCCAFSGLFGRKEIFYSFEMHYCCTKAEMFFVYRLWSWNTLYLGKWGNIVDFLEWMASNWGLVSFSFVVQPFCFGWHDQLVYCWLFGNICVYSSKKKKKKQLTVVYPSFAKLQRFWMKAGGKMVYLSLWLPWSLWSSNNEKIEYINSAIS